MEEHEKRADEQKEIVRAYSDKAGVVVELELSPENGPVHLLESVGLSNSAQGT